MFLVDRLILVGAILLLVGILSSKLSTRVGLPVLVLFILVGMLAGEDGIGRIEFDNYPVAHGIGTWALGSSSSTEVGGTRERVRPSGQFMGPRPRTSARTHRPSRRYGSE